MNKNKILDEIIKDIQNKYIRCVTKSFPVKVLKKKEIRRVLFYIRRKYSNNMSTSVKPQSDGAYCLIITFIYNSDLFKIHIYSNGTSMIDIYVSGKDLWYAYDLKRPTLCCVEECLNLFFKSKNRRWTGKNTDLVYD